MSLKINNNVISNNKTMKVKDVDGKIYPLNECIFYKNHYFHKKSKYVFLDCITNKYEHVENIFGFAKSIEIKNEKLIIEEGYTHYNNKCLLFRCYSRRYNFESFIYSLDNIKDWKFRENFSSCCITDYDEKDLKINEVLNYQTFKNKNFNITNDEEDTKFGRKSATYLLSEGIKHTFGVELEIGTGNLFSCLGQRLNLSCVRDGSLNGGSGGPEYVTGILTGDSGFNHLQEICSQLAKRTTVNSSCGIHVHLGNINFSKQLLINSYILYSKLENEIFKMLPKSRRENDYCKKLKKFNFSVALENKSLILEENYNVLFNHITNGKLNFPDGAYNKKTNHPLGSKCGYDKKTPRYCWINYVPAMFNTRGNESYSIEIRNFNGSTNFNKIKNWVLIQMAILHFADNYPQLIDSIDNLSDVINKVLPKRAFLLNNFIKTRKEIHSIEKSEIEEYNEKIINKQSIKEQICA